MFARVGLSSGLVGHGTPRAARRAVQLLSRGQAGLSTAFRLRALTDGDRPALVSGGQTFTFAEVDARADRVCAGLAALGLARRDAVALVMRNRHEFFELEVATARLGGSAVSLSWRATAAELRYMLEHSGARAICFEASLWPVIEEAIAGNPKLPRARCIALDDPGDAARGLTPYASLLEARPDPEAVDGQDDGAVVIYTSGTTGKPKGAVRKFGLGQVLGLVAFLDRVPFTRADRHLCVCPLYHSTALGFAGLTLMVGGCVVIEQHFDPIEVMKCIERERITTAALVPTLLHRWMSLDDAALAAFSTRSLRAVISVGAQLPAPLSRRVRATLGPVLYNLYGATETGLVSVATPDDLAGDPSSVGRPLHGVEVRLVDESGELVADRAVGELYARSAMLVAGYHADAAATSASMREGFFSVGDLARRDAEGRLSIVGRRRDMVISGGVNLYPVEIEAVIDAHPSVAQSAVIGVPDPEWGERLRAFVVLRGPCDAAALEAHCRATLSGAKVPREWVFLAALPSNATGKVLKRALALGQYETA